MEKHDFRKAAEEVVEKLHIFDDEWRESLVDQYAEALEYYVTNAKRQFTLLIGDLASI